MEGLNPTRRYRSFRPRQAVRGAVNLTDSGTNTACYLYNDTTGSQYIILRHFAFPNLGAAGDLESAYVRGKIGAQVGNTQPLLPSGAKLPGIITADGATTLANYDSFPFLGGNNNQFGYWPHDFPFAILEPGWSLAFVSTSGVAGFSAFFLWEAIFADELDYAFEL